MHTIDLSPFNRFSVGFDRMQRQLERMHQLDNDAHGYPPYNIEVLSENSYRIVMAVAGFSQNDLEIVQQEGTLFVKGRIQPSEKDEEEVAYLHRGIATRAFERRFEVADHIKVESANIADGLLTINLLREIPEALKPRKIEIARNGEGKSIEHKAA
ncbi:MAG: Hsp20 family protein [Rhodospirillaceae bacterium]|nr:Hsp20 family protein [Rhodospirillaceae bacterium]